MTVRDRLRVVQEKNQIKVNVLPTRHQSADLLDLAKGRVTWVQTKMYEFWNPDHVVPAATSNATASAKNRPVKNDVVMDLRWWGWNIAFAILPAALIGFYCEFRGQYLMHDYYEGLEQQQAARILGDEYVREHASELTAPPPENFVVRLYRVAQEVTSLLVGNRDDDDDNNNVIITDHGAAGRPQEMVDTVESTPVVPADSTVHASVEQLRRISTASDAKAEPISAQRSDTSQDELVRRVEHLESLLLKQEHERQRQINYQLERLQQSGTRNRMEDDLMQKWKHKVATATSQHQPQPAVVAAPPTPATPSASSKDADDTSANEMNRVNQVLKEAALAALNQVRPLLGMTEASSTISENVSVENKRQVSTADASASTLMKPAVDASTASNTDMQGTLNGTDIGKKKWWKPW